MNRFREYAELLLEKAQEDVRVLECLARDPNPPVSGVGFHAQQTVEKCLKAVLTGNNVEFDRTHNLGKLIAVLREKGLPLPPQADKMGDLTRYAVVLRYDRIASDEGSGEPLDVAWAFAVAREVEAWARAHLGMKDK